MRAQMPFAYAHRHMPMLVWLLTYLPTYLHSSSVSCYLLHPGRQLVRHRLYVMYAVEDECIVRKVHLE